ncbi:MAG TPA: hypothetical protein VFO10_21500 [Oligoflexus sp.]|uniref:hypothetical protein n=1 Tax=Oligoflexus sp. TaxID=1971216 RepID=UPI002D7F792A|nr:hypothetical protein [Oligoflexus sp.]HET9239851.1 hypothetical protein [Oligoflexus sp.]
MFSAALMGSSSGSLQAEAWPFFPLSLAENADVPLVQRKMNLDAHDVRLMDGAERHGERYHLPVKGRVVILQKAQDELRMEGLSGNDQAWRWAERSGPLAITMDNPAPVSGVVRIPAADRDRWIEIVAREQLDVSLHALRSEEVGARLEDEMRAQSLAGDDVRVTRQDGREDTFYRVTRDASLVLRSPALVKIQSRMALPLLKDDQKSLCVVRYQTDAGEHFVQNASAPSPYESGRMAGKNIGVGSPSVFYLVLSEAAELKLASNCLLNVQSLPLERDTPLVDDRNHPQLFAAWAKSKTKPLETFLQLARIPRETTDYRLFQALQRQLMGNALYFRALYPEDLKSSESVNRIRAAFRRDHPDARLNAALIPEAQQADCLCVQSAEERRTLSFTNPSEGRETLARIVVPEQQKFQDLDFQMVFMDPNGKIIKRQDARMESISGDGAQLAAVTVSVPAKTRTIAITRRAQGPSFPRLGLEILLEKEAGVDQAALMQQLRDPKKGLLAFVMEGKSDSLSLEDQLRLMPMRQSLQRQSEYLKNLTTTPMKLDAAALHQARRAMIAEGSFHALRNICLGSINGQGTLAKEAFYCLRETLRGMQDYRSLAVILGWQYKKTPSDTIPADYIDALNKAGYPAEALMLAAEYARTSKAGQPLLQDLQSSLPHADILLQSDSLPRVQRFAKSVFLLDRVAAEKRQAFTLEDKQRIQLESDSPEWETFELEWRARASHEDTSPLHWVQVARAQTSRMVPLLLEGTSNEWIDEEKAELSYPARFLIQIKKGAPVKITGRGELLYLRMKRVPNSMITHDRDELVHVFPEDPKDDDYLAAFSRIGQWEESRRMNEAMTLRAALIADLRKAKPLTWPHVQRLRILENGMRWMPLPTEVQAAQLMREEFTAYAPDHPVMAAQKALLPRMDADVITIVGSEEEDVTELELSQNASLRMQIRFLALDESGRLPQDIEMKVDEGPWQSLTLHKKDSTHPLELTAGVHRIGLRFKEKGGPRYLAMKLAAPTGAGWTQLQLKKVKYWAVPTPAQPLVLKTAGLYRIHRLKNKRVDIQYRAVKKGESFTVPEGDAAYRFYTLTADDDKRPRRERFIRLASLVDEPVSPDFAMPEATRPVYSVSDAPALSLALGTRSNCREEDNDKPGFCDDVWHPKLALTLSQRREDSQTFGRVSVFPGALPLGQLTLGWDKLSPSRALSYEIEGHAFFADNAGESLQGGGGSLGVFYKTAWGSLDAQSGLRLNAWEANRRRIHPDLPQEVASQWKSDHRRTLGISQSLEQKSGLSDSFRLNLAATTNPPGADQDKVWDQASVVASWLRAWTPVISTGLGYEARYYFRDERRADYLLRYSPRFSLVALNYDALQWPILTRIQVGLESDSPRTVFSLTIETPLGKELNPDAASLRNFPFSDQGRGEIFKRHVQ